MTDAVIRRATLEDTDALSRIGRETFVETFGHLYPAEDLTDFLEQAYGLERTKADLADPDKASWIVEADGKVVGYALAGPSALPHPDVAPRDGELKRLYVRKALQGSGTGSRLLAQALDWLEARGCKRIWIGVWSQNHGAQRLYSRVGFKKVGEYEFPVGRVRDQEFILVRTAQP
jgi:ribosomal protein S18 acetylase RimI-like enzyme